MTPSAARGRLLRGAALLVAVVLAGCKPTKFEATSNVPPPVIERMPVVVGVHIPTEFREKVYTEKRSAVNYSVALGKAQTDAFVRMMQAMFSRVVMLEVPAAAAKTDAEIRGVLEPVLEDYAVVTPTDSGKPMYAASLKYTINLYSPRGEPSGSWTFTGYGTQPASSFPGQEEEALKAATSLAMRDAAAKLVAEFRDQAIVRGLLAPGSVAAPAELAPPAP